MKKKLVVGFVAATLAALLVTPAHANPSKGPLASAAVVQCSIALDHFPQPVKTTNSSNCNGVAAGVFGGLSSTPGGAVAGIAAASPASITAQYTEPCVEGALGFSNGRGTVTNLTVANVTKGASLTTAANGVASIPYSWTRVGAVAVITTGKLNPVVDAKKGSQSTLTWTGGSAADAVGGLGLGILIPTAVPDTACPGAPMVVEIVSVLVGL